MFKATGTLIYDPKSEGATRKGFEFWWMKLDVPQSIIHYYQYVIKRELGMTLNFPLWKSHVTVSRGEKPTKVWLWKKYHGEKIEFEYSPDIRMSPTYVWLPVRCERLNEIRAELGLSPVPKVPYHCTIGNRKNLNEVKNEAPTLPFKTFPWEDAKNVDFLYKRRQREQSKKK